jgi:tight adherence protein C
MSSATLALGVGALLFCIVVTVMGPHAAKQEKVRSRLDDLGEALFRAGMLRDEELNKPFSERVLKPILHRMTELLASLIPIHGMTSVSANKQKKLLLQTGWAISLEEYTTILLICMACGGLAGLVLALLTHAPLYNILLFVIIGLFAGYTLLRYSCSAVATRRKTAMERQLPDMLDLLSVSVAAGLGFERAMLHIINTMEGPLIDEFTVTYREMSMGRPRNEALALLADRCGVDDLNTVTGALIQAGELGIPIRNVLQSQAAGLRRIRKSKVQEQAAKVSTKILLPMVAFIFPVLLIILLGPSILSILEAFS